MLNKNVYIVDCQSMYYLEDLRQELIKEIKSDSLENNDNIDIIESNLNLLEKVCDEKWKYNENFIIDELKAYGVNVLKVHEILKHLDELKAYYNNSFNEDNDFEIMINNLMEQLKNYFND